MSKYEKTAKDRAFDRERAKLGVKIKDLQEQLQEKRSQIRADSILCNMLNDRIEELKKENELLRGMIQLQPEELERFLKEQRESAERTQRIKQGLELLGLAKTINHY